MSKTAVLFCIFNRPDTTQKVFESIMEYKPTRLYVASDGHREQVDGEKALCKRARDIIKKVDWECEVKTLFREKNLGCKRAMSSAIDWFFEHEDEGIILEDDTVADKTFFPFCSYMLEKYKNDARIFGICGTNFRINSKEKEPYYFSNFFNVWGWATWKRVWKFYEVDEREIIYKWKNKKLRKNFLMSLGLDIEKRLYYIRYLTVLLYEKDYNTWDTQFNVGAYINHGLFIYPRNNLISNIGTVGTHSRKITHEHFYPTQAIKDYKDYKPIYVMPEYRTYSKIFNYIFSFKFIKDYIYCLMIKLVYKVSILYKFYKKINF